jgi:hypothetical protein
MHDCTGLTALHLECCEVASATPKAFAAIAALPELQVLCLKDNIDELGEAFFGQLQNPSKLTHLSLGLDTSLDATELVEEQLSQLQKLVNLEHLSLKGFYSYVLQGGLPSQLTKLTCLVIDIDFFFDIDWAAKSFQNLSKMTALQELNLNIDLTARDLFGIKYTQQLTSLAIESSDLECSTHNLKAAGLTALKRLALTKCSVQPAALAALTNLQDLSLDDVVLMHDAPLVELLDAVAQLPKLTELSLFNGEESELDPAPAAAFTSTVGQHQPGFHAAAPVKQGCP